MLIDEITTRLLAGDGADPSASAALSALFAYAQERALAMKMSKSRPDTSIFVTDTPEEVAKKLKKAYCPEGTAFENPVLEYCKYLIFPLLQEQKPISGHQQQDWMLQITIL